MASFRFRINHPNAKEHQSETFEIADEELMHSMAWTYAEYGHGEIAGMKVSAPALEGCKIKFVVEHRHGADWALQETVTATVVNGIAKAKLPVQHPHVAAGGKAEEAQAADLRFSCQLA